MKVGLKVASVVGTVVSVAFAYHFAQMMPLVWYIFFLIMSCFISLTIFYGLSNMAYFPSQAGQERGSPHGDLQPDQDMAFNHSDHNLLDEGLAPASFGQAESAVPPMVDAGQAAIQMSSLRRSGVLESSRAVEEYRILTFRTKSEEDVLDDGYKWRWNGKKFVKNSPFPRRYYRCKVCSVTKRIQRDKEDPSYVMTTYKGTHNHEP